MKICTLVPQLVKVGVKELKLQNQSINTCNLHVYCGLCVTKVSRTLYK